MAKRLINFISLIAIAVKEAQRIPSWRRASRLKDGGCERIDPADDSGACLSVPAAVGHVADFNRVRELAPSECPPLPYTASGYNSVQRYDCGTDGIACFAALGAIVLLSAAAVAQNFQI